MFEQRFGRLQKSCTLLIALLNSRCVFKRVKFSILVVAASVLLAGCTINPETGFPDVPNVPGVPNITTIYDVPAFVGRDCSSDVQCFVGALQTCSEAFVTLPMGWQRILGKSGVDCVVESSLTEGQVRGNYLCRVPPRYINEGGWFIPACEIKTHCSGDLADVLAESCTEKLAE